MESNTASANPARIMIAPSYRLCNTAEHQWRPTGGRRPPVEGSSPLRVSSSRERSGSQLAATLVGRLARAGLISLTGLALLAFAACDLMPSAATPPTPTHIPFGVS